MTHMGPPDEHTRSLEGFPPQQDSRWYDLARFPIGGKGYAETCHAYDRLPTSVSDVPSEAVQRQSRHSTGLYIQFSTNSSSIEARTMLRVPPPPETQYIKYLDLYAWDEGNAQWRWAGSSVHGYVPSGQTPLVRGLPPEHRIYRLYFPLTYEVERIEIGIDRDADLAPVPVAPVRSSIAIYGTSVVKASHSSRPGMTWPAILGRRMNRHVFNLGFSGAARMEPELATVLAGMQPAVWIIDPLPNMSIDLVRSNAEPFLRVLLNAQPDVPIVLAEDRTHAHAWLLPDYFQRQRARRECFRAVFDKLRSEGASNLHYLEMPKFTSEQSEITVDGSHPSDLGNQYFAEFFLANLINLLPDYFPNIANPTPES